MMEVMKCTSGQWHAWNPPRTCSSLALQLLGDLTGDRKHDLTKTKAKTKTKENASSHVPCANNDHPRDHPSRLQIRGHFSSLET
jgi:hypothetical protein